MARNASKAEINSIFAHRPFMSPGESLCGYLIRFAEANYLLGLKGLSYSMKCEAKELVTMPRKLLMANLFGDLASERMDRDH